ESWIKSIGGSTLDSNVRRVLSRIFGHEYSLEFNFTGKGGKKSFKKLAICSAVTRAIVEKRGATEDIVERMCANWFRFGKDRNGGRNRRNRNPTVATSR
ncbi:unnamed protein product, partial [Allacma fusca]